MRRLLPLLLMYELWSTRLWWLAWGLLYLPSAAGLSRTALTALIVIPQFSPLFKVGFTWGFSMDPYVMPLVEVGRKDVHLLLKPLQFHDEGGVPR